jgi:L-proline dehydrogenase (EC 1.5.99.8)
MIPPFARSFLAGETPAEAVAHATELNSDNIGVILNLLGEHYHDRREAAADTRAYCRLIEDIDRADLRACVSVKPTQLGLAISEDCFREHLEHVVACAAEHDVFVWIDMEDHETTDATLDAFEHHAREHGDVGVCIQANLRRTGEDLERLAPLPGKVRLVKGAYDPPTDIAYQSRERIGEAMRSHLRFMFREFDDGVALGSHDPDLVTLAADLHQTHGTPYEVQMLMGVRTGAQSDLANHHEMWQYAPYGERWLSYFYRRVTENAENARFAARAVLPG